MTYPVFQRLGLPTHPVFLAPLAGVSDHPFRRICHRGGADLTYVEMISATALLYGNQKTLAMLARHPEEELLGVQLTGKSADETARAVELLDKMSFETIDLNMGCPVKKVVKTGCGSAILKDPERVYQTLRLCREATDKPLSAKIRIGWDRSQVNALEVAEAIEKGGADWMTVHGRTRQCDYGVPVDLNWIAKVKAAVAIPVFGNGNIFSAQDAVRMRACTGVDGVMVSRGALGNPWIFGEIKKAKAVELGIEEWLTWVMDHLEWQRQAYGERGMAAVCMRKHLLWYTKGWSGGKKVREAINAKESLTEAKEVLQEFALDLQKSQTQSSRYHVRPQGGELFAWDPKYEMDRTLDRGVFDARHEVSAGV